jgi:hypothetical protein
VNGTGQPGFVWKPRVTSQSGYFEFRPGFMSRSGRQRGQGAALAGQGPREEGTLFMECCFSQILREAGSLDQNESGGANFRQYL